jgi:hypothetical protein
MEYNLSDENKKSSFADLTKSTMAANSCDSRRPMALRL